MNICRKNINGFTLIELVVVIVIIGIIGSVALQQVGNLSQTGKIEDTKNELDMLAFAIIGNPELRNNNTRTDFGYVGDIGALPPNLDALVTDPGYATWDGPYIKSDFLQYIDDFKKDAWQTDYILAGVTITSNGSGSTIERRLAGSASELLLNEVAGNILDLDGTPPGTDYKDSLAIRMTIPDGGGGTIMKSMTPDIGGYFNFDSIPIGNHALDIIYIPNYDTISRFVSVIPNSKPYGEYRLPANIWTSGTSGGGGTQIEFVPNSDSLITANCFKLIFWIQNNTGNPITVSSLTLTWGAPTAYFKQLDWNGTTVRTGNPALGSGDMINFSTAQTINDGQSVQINVDAFHSNSNGSGPPVDLTNTNFTVDFSDGSSITFTADYCGG